MGGPGPRGMPYGGGGDRRGPRPPMGGGRPMGQQMGGEMARNRPNQGHPHSFDRTGEKRPLQNPGSKPQTQSLADQLPKQSSKDITPVSSSITLADLKNKWQEFVKLDKEKQRNILGELLFPLIKERVGESIAPKITGMLIDLDVLEISEIFEFLEDRELLNERISEAKDLILSEGN